MIDNSLFNLLNAPLRIEFHCSLFSHICIVSLSLQLSWQENIRVSSNIPSITNETSRVGYVRWLAVCSIRPVRARSGKAGVKSCIVHFSKWQLTLDTPRHNYPHWPAR